MWFFNKSKKSVVCDYASSKSHNLFFCLLLSDWLNKTTHSSYLYFKSPFSLHWAGLEALCSSDLPSPLVRVQNWTRTLVAVLLEPSRAARLTYTPYEQNFCFYNSRQQNIMTYSAYNLQKIAQSYIQVSFQYLQGRWIHNLYGQPGSVLCYLCNKQIVPHIQMELQVFPFVPIVPRPKLLNFLC